MCAENVAKTSTTFCRQILFFNSVLFSSMLRKMKRKWQSKKYEQIHKNFKITPGFFLDIFKIGSFLALQVFF